jgi:hypothetical protein
MCSLQGFILLAGTAFAVGFTLLAAYFNFQAWRGYRHAKKRMRNMK